MAETTQETIRSPFHAAHAALGATFMEEGGWFWTEGFGDLDAEYRGVRDDLGVWDVSPLNKWEFRGRDALKAAAADWQAILGKFLASWLFLIVALVLSFPIVVTVNVLGDPDNGVIASGYVGAALLAGAYLAISCMTSALTRNQVIAFILAVVLCLLLILVGFSPLTDLLARWASPWLVEAVAKFSVLTHYDGFQKGVLDSRDLLYFLSVIAYALFATGVVIRNHRTG